MKETVKRIDFEKCERTLYTAYFNYTYNSGRVAVETFSDTSKKSLERLINCRLESNRYEFLKVEAVTSQKIILH